jgi:drug/metabolite transporter (DMT)-like permease
MRLGSRAERPHIWAIALVCAATFLWALIDTVAELFNQPQPAAEVVWARYGFHLALLFSFLAIRGRARTAFQSARPWSQGLRGLLMLGMPVFFILAAARLSTGLIWSEFWIAPLLILIFAPPLLAERTSRLQWGVALTAFTGVVLMNGVATDGLSWAELLPLAMAACFGVYVLLSRQLSHERLSTSLFYTAVAAFVPLTPLVFFLGQLPTWHDLAVMAAIGAMGLVFLWALDRACATVDVSALAPYFYLEPLWLAALRFRILGEVPHRGTLIGGLIVVLAIAGGAALAQFSLRRTVSAPSTVPH